jgi:hypothetical protein
LPYEYELRRAAERSEQKRGSDVKQAVLAHRTIIASSYMTNVYLLLLPILSILACDERALRLDDATSNSFPWFSVLVLRYEFVPLGIIRSMHWANWNCLYIPFLPQVCRFWRVEVLV